MRAWSPLLRWYLVRVLLLLLALLAHGCGYSTYNIPPAELQRLTQLPPSQRGEHVRVYTDGVVPAAAPSPPVTAPSPPVAPAPAIPPPTAPPTPQPPDASVNGQSLVEPEQAEEVVVPIVEPAQPSVVVAVDLIPPAPVPPPHMRPAPPRLHPVATRPNTPPPVATAPRPGPRLPVSPGHGALPASAGRGPAPIVHAGHGAAGLHHSGGGGGGGGSAAAVGAVVGAVVLVGVMVALANASEPVLFDGWIHTDSEHPLHLIYTSGWEREIRLCDLKPADLVGVRSAVMYNTEGAIQHLQSAVSPPPPAQPR